MSNAVLFVEAVDTAVTLGRALAVWLLVLAVAASVVTLAGIAAVAWAVKTARRLLYARLSHEHAPQAPESASTVKRPHTPAWAHTQPHRYEETA